jgi:hypothetical protein
VEGEPGERGRLVVCDHDVEAVGGQVVGQEGAAGRVLLGQQDRGSSGLHI